MTGAGDRIPWDVRDRLQDPLETLAGSLRLWEGRDESKPQPHVRRAASKAVDAIDEMLRELYLMRARLISEVRVSDDAAAVRADALLAERRDAGTPERRGRPVHRYLGGGSAAGPEGGGTGG